MWDFSAFDETLFDEFAPVGAYADPPDTWRTTIVGVSGFTSAAGATGITQTRGLGATRADGQRAERTGQARAEGPDVPEPSYFITAGDDPAPLRETLLDATGAAVNIQGATVIIHIAPINGATSPTINSAATNDQIGDGSDGSKGKVSFTWPEGGIAVPRVVRLRVASDVRCWSRTDFLKRD
jgi:hypothetical protein